MRFSIVPRLLERRRSRAVCEPCSSGEIATVGGKRVEIMFRDTANSLHRSSNPVSIRTRRTVIGRPPRIADNHCQPTRVVADQRDETLRVPLTYRITVSISNYTPSWIDTGGEKNSREREMEDEEEEEEKNPPSPCALAWNLLSLQPPPSSLFTSFLDFFLSIYCSLRSSFSDIYQGYSKVFG